MITLICTLKSYIIFKHQTSPRRSYQIFGNAVQIYMKQHVVADGNLILTCSCCSYQSRSFVTDLVLVSSPPILKN